MQNYLGLQLCILNLVIALRNTTQMRNAFYKLFANIALVCQKESMESWLLSVQFWQKKHFPAIEEREKTET